MADLIVSGSTNPEALNGDYSEDGELNGKTRYKHDSQNYWVFWSTDRWKIQNSNMGTGANYFQRIDANVLGAYTADDGEGDVVVSEPEPPEIIVGPFPTFFK